MLETTGRDLKTNPSLSLTEPPALVDRDGQLDVIERLVTDCAEGMGRLLLLTGPAGIGKTRLVAAARERAQAAGYLVLHARAGELERAFSYGVVRQLFEPTLRKTDKGERRALFEGAASLAGPLFGLAPKDVGVTTEVDPSFGTLHGLFWLTAGLAEQRPLLLAIDDLHWCDPPSLRYLLYLARRMEGLSLLVVAGLRPDEPDADTATVADLESDPLATVLRVQPLSHEGVSTLIEQAFVEAPTPAFSHAVFESCGGNPLLVRELIRAAIAAGTPPTARGADLVREMAAESVSGLVLRRVDRLGPNALALARSVALLGEGAALEIAAALARLDLDEASGVARKLARMDVFEGRGSVAFAHPMLRAAVYADLSEAERQLGHRRAAELLSELRATPEQVATHLIQTRPAADDAVVTALREAAQRAMARGAPDAAVTYLRRALAEPPGDQLADVLLELGTAEAHIGDGAGVEHLRAAHDLVEERPMSAPTGMALARALFVEGRIREAAEVLAEVSDQAEAGGSEADDRLEAELAFYALLNPELHQLSQRLLSQWRQRVIPDTVGGRAIRASIAVGLMLMGDHPQKARSEAERAVSGGPGGAQIAPPFMGAIGVLVYLDELDRVLAVTDAWLEVARKSGSVLDFAVLSYYRYQALFRRGDLVEAEAELRSAIQTGRAFGLVRDLPFALPALAELLWLRGLKDEAAAALRSSVPVAQLSATYSTILFLDYRGRAHLALGLVSDALDDFRKAGEHLLTLGMTNPSYSAWRSQAALVLSSRGKLDESQRLVQEEIELARQWGVPRPIGIALRNAGLLRGGDEGLDLLRESVSVLEGAPAPLERAQSLIELGAALRRANDRVAARDPLHEGLDLATRCGAAPLAERARDELLASGARPRRVAVSGPEALTPSEARVARMAATGQSNRDIAQALFVTKKTVEVHLSNAYRKLGIQSRSQLAGSLDELDADERARLAQ
jgi:DNA-binding CsgD family transcriptional regulator